jgi:hypothetical protein
MDKVFSKINLFSYALHSRVVLPVIENSQIQHYFRAVKEKDEIINFLRSFYKVNHSISFAVKLIH